MAAVTRGKTPAQLFALVFGAVYLLVGVAGFAVTGFTDFIGDTNENLILFELNPLHNLVHIAIGALWLGASRGHPAAKGINATVGAVYVLVGLLGLFGLLDTLLSNNPADSLLHLVSGAVAVYFGTAGAGLARRPAAT